MTARPSVPSEAAIKELWNCLTDERGTTDYRNSDHAAVGVAREATRIALNQVYALLRQAQLDAFTLHRCEVCGCYWRLFRDSWSMWPGQQCGKCCDNVPMDHVKPVHSDWPALPSSGEAPALPSVEEIEGIFDETVVGGQTLPRSIAQHVQRCERCILEEQEKPLPDNALIDVLCDAVRFAREHCQVVAEYLASPPAEPPKEAP